MCLVYPHKKNQKCIFECWQHNFALMLQPNTTFLELARQKQMQVSLLMDFDNFQHVEKINKMSEIVKAGAVQGGIVIVLAVSSSGGCNPLQLAFYHLTTVMFLPFTDNEGQRFI